MVRALEVRDVQLEFLGDYFVDGGLSEKEGITFAQFLEQVKNGRQLDNGKGETGK